MLNCKMFTAVAAVSLSGPLSRRFNSIPLPSSAILLLSLRNLSVVLLFHSVTLMAWGKDSGNYLNQFCSSHIILCGGQTASYPGTRPSSRGFFLLFFLLLWVICYPQFSPSLYVSSSQSHTSSSYLVRSLSCPIQVNLLSWLAVTFLHSISPPFLLAVMSSLLCHPSFWPVCCGTQVCGWQYASLGKVKQVYLWQDPQVIITSSVFAWAWLIYFNIVSNIHLISFSGICQHCYIGNTPGIIQPVYTRFADTGN